MKAKMMTRCLNFTNYTEVKENVFESYEENTIEPGGILLIILIFYCFMSIYLVPVTVIILNRNKQRRRREEEKVNLETTGTSTVNDLQLKERELQHYEHALKEVEIGESNYCLNNENEKSSRFNKVEDISYFDEIQGVNKPRSSNDFQSSLKEGKSFNHDTSHDVFESDSKHKEQADAKDDTSFTTKMTVFSGLKVVSTKSIDTSIETCDQPNCFSPWTKRDRKKIDKKLNNNQNTSRQQNSNNLVFDGSKCVGDNQDEMQNELKIPSPPSEIVLVNKQLNAEEPNNSDSKGIEAIEAIEISIIPNSYAISSNVKDSNVKSNQGSNESPFELTDKNESKEYQMCYGKNAIWKKQVVILHWNKMRKIAAYDNETKQILKLAIPYTLGAILEAVFDMIYLALIGNILGTRALSAYAVVEAMLEVSDEFISGVIDAGMTVISHCVGTGNNYLAGQYVQMSALLYVLALIPAAILWWYYMYDIILWFGLDEEIAILGQMYTEIALISEFIGGFGSTFESFLEVTGFEVFSLIISVIGEFSDVAIFIILWVTNNTELLNLRTVAYIDLAVTIAYSILIISIPIYMGWIKEYVNGIFFNISFKNISALKNLLKTALPLSLGSMIAYGEWEVLTIFAAHLGPAEVASWLLLGNIWEVFEVTTEAIGDTAEVRVGYHLGRGNPEMAQFSANKTLLWGTCASFFVTVIFFSIGDHVAIWFTTDETIQQMVRMAIPYISIGNVTMTFGMLCWSILGAQGRYNLATFILFLTSWIIVIPVAALFTYKWRFNIKGLVSSIVFGYSFTATCMAIIILVSDWKKCSDEIIAINAKNGVEEYSESESESNHERSDDSYISSSSSSQSTSSSSRVSRQVINDLAEIFEYI